ncbi:3-methyladenine DNA glycosylase [Flexivirga endophytica]|uniref:3-methyladenine DNA glycosylase n=1 Tax=Flexivirga endophytica TaxID=1849103 RepID=A0A916TBH9_9MICO|nr:DNA-3-methyladenine glycosylase 2 family protein [Flexivirga endophytica]GGB38964.1 3-methyladenine DNA glycosylase [Flexivirga endophytica]GHB46924.1 3-methyladenine DNA glycosylase [Flexivirga endophytica]
MTAPAATADFAPGRPVPLGAILGTYRHGAGDPTFHTTADVVWRATRTPEGPATVRLHREPAPTGDRVVAQAWGAGATWILEGLPELLGAADDPRTFEIQHDSLRHIAKEQRHWRIARSRLVLDSLIPAIIEQRVTGKQAFGAYRQLVRRHGAPAPGPTDAIAAIRLMLPPDVAGWRRIPSWEWLRAGVDGRRADTVQRVLQVAPRLEECASLPRENAWQRLRSVPGVGVWTAAETMQRAAGDADAVSFGDYHIAKDIGHALTGAPVNDEELERLLRPYAGHRYRVQFLVMSGRLGAPRHGPRLAIPTHLPG